MFEFDDPWWIVALILLLGLWVVEIAIPVTVTRPSLAAAERYLDYDEQEDEPPPKRPSIVWPLLAVFFSALLTSLAVYKMITEYEGGTRWQWMAAAGGVTLLGAMVLVRLVAKVAENWPGPS